jgi:predicted Rossmann fold nucleotide-binding protein DprA/Smf involved in DNA uptake
LDNEIKNSEISIFINNLPMDSLSKAVVLHMIGWQNSLDGLRLTGMGNQCLLDVPMTAFFASRQCPGAAIRAAMDWALHQAREKNVVVSGFHSPLEQSVLKVLITAHSPAVVVLARPVEGAKLPPEWAEALALGTMAVVSAVATTTRLTDEVATARNQLVTQLAASIVVAHASAGGALEGLCTQWQLQGRLVNRLALITAP